MSRLRVLHVIPAVAPCYGGPSRAVLGMGRALERLGVETLLAATDADGSSRLDVPHGVETRHEGVRSIFFRRQASESFKVSRPLARWLRGSVADFDVVHVHAVFSHASLAAGRACRGAGVPYIVRPLGTLAPWSLGRSRLKKRLLWRVAAERLVRGAARMHYTTSAEREQAERALGLEGGVVIPLGVEDDLLDLEGDGGRFRAAHPALGASPYVLFLSRIDPKKRLELLMDAFAEATRSAALASWRLVVAGSGEPQYVERVRRHAARLPGAERIVFAGWLEGAMRESALRGAGLLALPSHQENFGLSAIEALACGVPVLVSDGVDVAPEIERARAGWVAALEGETLPAVLGEALAGDAERRARGGAGRELVRSRYRWAAVAPRLVELYRGMA